MRTYVTIVAAGLVGVAPASADVIMFDNSGGVFNWGMGDSNGDPPANTLDITQDVSQSGTASPLGLVQWHHSRVSSDSYASRTIGTFGGAAQVAADPVKVPVLWGDGLASADFEFLQVYGVGDVIGPGALWRDHSYYLVKSFADSHELSGQGYLGVKLQISGQTHYGWVHVEFEPARGFQGGPTVTALAWAYETLPNTPITIVPAPGAAALFVGGMMAAGLRRRRR